MPSPFPGIDPFIESQAFWSDFHARFVNYWCEAISEALPNAYEAGLGERVYLIEHDPDSRKLVFPDVAVLHEDELQQPAKSRGIATLEPVTIPLTILEGPRETFIEIIHRPDHNLVTALELLPPANKQQPGRTEYLAKRNAMLYQNVHLVELDLLRGGSRLPLAGPLPAGDGYYLVSRADKRPDCQVYAWPMPHQLPTLPVPLRAPDADLKDCRRRRRARAARDRGHRQYRSFYVATPIPFRAPRAATWPKLPFLAQNLAPKIRSTRPNTTDHRDRELARVETLMQVQVYSW
ncbi:MAG: DUF4058 family protein [Pirellulaceae bacterium]